MEDTRLLWFTRGHGWGHATRDMLILKNLREILGGNIKIDIYSRGDGIEAYSAYGCSVNKLNDSEEMGLKIREFTEILSNSNANIVIADEEIFVPPIAKGMNKQCFFITNWLPFSNYYFEYSCIEASDLVFAVEYEDLFYPMEKMKTNVMFTGPIIREKQKREHKKKNEIKKILISFGGCSDQSSRKFILEAMEKISRSIQDLKEKVEVIWITGNESGHFDLTCMPENMIINSYDKTNNFLDLAFQCDGAIISAGINTMWELCLMGIKILAVPHTENILETKNAHQMKQRGLISYTSGLDELEKEVGLFLKDLKENESRNDLKVKCNTFYNEKQKKIGYRSELMIAKKIAEHILI